ncbi:MAG: hypothetical protein AAGD01_05580 [Acidobacteriota bacterium]
MSPAGFGDPSDLPVSWWGELAPTDEVDSRCWFCSFEGLDLWLQSFDAGEWRFVWRYRDDRRAESPEGIPVRAPRRCSPEALPADGKSLRALGVDDLHLVPRLADRPVVARPREPFVLLPGARQQAYLSTPVWVCLQNDSATSVLELPARQLSQTWFGPNARVGEVAYAQRTSLRTRLDWVGRSSDRAITPVLLENHGSESLRIQRFSLPAPALTLYRDRRGHLWTQRITVRRAPAADSVEVDLGRRPPAEAQGAEELSSSRVVAHRSLLVRALSSLFG